MDLQHTIKKHKSLIKIYGFDLLLRKTQEFYNYLLGYEKNGFITVYRGLHVGNNKFIKLGSSGEFSNSYTVSLEVAKGYGDFIIEGDISVNDIKWEWTINRALEKIEFYIDEYKDSFNKLTAFKDIDYEKEIIIDDDSKLINIKTYPEEIKIMKEIYFRKMIKSLLENSISSENLSPEQIKEHNLDLIRKNLKMYFKYITDEIFEYYLKEVGIEPILDFLSVEDGSNFLLQAGHTEQPNPVKFNQTDVNIPDEDPVQRVIRQNKIPYTRKEIQMRLVQYFIRRLVANVPEDKKFQNTNEITAFLKMYEQKFLYGYLMELAKVGKQRRLKGNQG